MSFTGYIKEKWYMFALFILSAVFSASVYYLDKQAFLDNPSSQYILYGIALFIFVFVVLDYLVLRHRAKKLEAFIKNGAMEEMDFVFPADALYAKRVSELAGEYNSYRMQIAQDSAQEMDFITKWVHDVKVPISAMKLLLENDAKDLKERLDMNLSAIEQDTQKVLFHIKSKSFYDDYKIEKTDTKSIISAHLKPFAVFFAYKKIALKIVGDSQSVLTDSKWSGYIFSQFLSNAVKHTPDGGEILIETVKLRKGAAISVTNTGEGIEKRDLANVFKRGYTSAERDKPKATGYGLYLAKKLADKMGHDLKAESEPDRYAKFTIIFTNAE